MIKLWIKNLLFVLGLGIGMTAYADDLPSLGENNEEMFNPWRSRVLLSSYVAGTAFYGIHSWWGKDTEKHEIDAQGRVHTVMVSNRSSHFHVNKEGWFGKDTPNGGADKLGHAFSFYLSTRLLTRGLEWSGYARESAALLAGSTSALVSLAVEVMDGYTLEYGFSKEDLVMNLAGVAAAIALEYQPTWDDVFDFRVHYLRSDDAKRLGERDPISDYSGQTYLLAAKASGIPALKDHAWLRYLELSVGYGSRGYQPNPGPALDTQDKQRYVFYGLSVNLSEVLRATMFKRNQAPTRVQAVSESVLEYLQLPGTAVWIKQKL
jgi:hypothetical protein